MLSYDETELTESITEFEQRLHPEDRERVLRAAKDHIDGRLSVFSLEFRMQQKAGGWVWIHSRGSVQRDDEGVPYRMAGLIATSRHGRSRIQIQSEVGKGSCFRFRLSFPKTLRPASNPTQHLRRVDI